MLKNPIAIAVLAVIVVAGGVWLYMYSTDPLHDSCRHVLADWDNLGPKTADALYDSLTDAQKARTTRAGTRMYLDTACRIESDIGDTTVEQVRAKMEQNLSAPAP